MNTIDLVVPCFNPPDDWPNMVLDTYRSLVSCNNDINYNFILVDDGSLRNPFEKMKEMIQENNWIIVRHTKNQGKGAALKSGIDQSKSAYLVYTDMDFPYTIKSIQSISENIIGTDVDILVGVRESQYFDVIPIHRKLISKVLLYVNRHLLGLKIYDTQAGLKAMSSVGKDLAMSVKSNRFLFDLELLKRAKKLKGVTIRKQSIILRQGVQLSKIKPSHLLRELPDFLRILAL